MGEFASVGKSLIIQAVGIQANYKEVILDEIDIEKSGCLSCPHYYLSDHAACENCSAKQYIVRKVYHNELNRHGYKPMLKLNAIKLLVLLHFMHPDSNGIIKNVRLSVLAQKLNCDVRTIKNNLLLLDKYGYVKYCQLDAKRINLLIQDYKRAFLNASEGGTGFIVLNDLFLEKILSLNNINALRIYLRSMVEIDSANVKSGYSGNVLEKTYGEMRRGLPHYCKRNVIMKALAGCDDVFSITHDRESNIITLTLRTSYAGKESRIARTNSYIKLFNDFLEDFNAAVLAYNRGNKELPNPYLDVFTFYENASPITLLPEHIDNMAHLAVEYSFEQVVEAFKYIYVFYYMVGTKIENLGGLMRTIMDNTSYGYSVA